MKFQFKAKTTSTGISFKKSDLLDGLKDVPVDTSVLVQITDQRNLGENNLFHLYCSVIADHTGHTLREIKFILKEEFLGYDYFTIDGVEKKELKSTTDLSIKEFAVLLSQVESWAWENLQMTLNRRMYG